MPNQLIASIHNSHVAACGTPPLPVLVPDQQDYFSYFQNRHGEQWICWVKDKQFELRAGDYGWETPLTAIRISVAAVSQIPDNLLQQVLLAGVTMTKQMLGKLPDRIEDELITFVVQRDDHSLVSVARDEHAWINACLQACGALDEPRRDFVQLVDPVGSRSGSEFLLEQVEKVRREVKET